MPMIFGIIFILFIVIASGITYSILESKNKEQVDDDFEILEE